MNTDQNGRILCDCGRRMTLTQKVHCTPSLGVGEPLKTIINFECPTHGIRHTLRVIEELPA